MLLSVRPVANPVVVLREEADDWAILFNPDTAEAVGINPVGVCVWKLLDGDRSVDDLVNEVHERFSEVPEAAPEELREFVQGLVDRGFVGVEAAGGAQP